MTLPRHSDSIETPCVSVTASQCISIALDTWGTVNASDKVCASGRDGEGSHHSDTGLVSVIKPGLGFAFRKQAGL